MSSKKSGGKQKPQIHVSMLTQLEGCGEQFRRRYGARFGWNDREEIIAPGVALITGIGTHKAVEENLNSKIRTGVLLPVAQVMDIARDTAADLWQGEVFLQEDEAVNVEQTKGESIDMAVKCAGAHAAQLAPKLSPKSVERKWVIKLENFPYDLAGKIDIEEEIPSSEEGLAPISIVRDTKTAGKSPNANAADISEQLSMYALAKKVVDGVEPSALYLDTLVKSANVKIVTQGTKRSDFQLQVLLRRVERAIEIIQKGAFTPAREDDWRCSPKWCGYWSTCPFGGKNR